MNRARTDCGDCAEPRLAATQCIRCRRFLCGTCAQGHRCSVARDLFDWMREVNTMFARAPTSFGLPAPQLPVPRR